MGSAVIGGVVYRGSEIPGLVGSYLFADRFHHAWRLVHNGGVVAKVEEILLNAPQGLGINSFGVDAFGEVYICDGLGGIGEIYKLVADTDCNDNGIPDVDDISKGTSSDCEGNGVPDECQFAGGTSVDCNANTVPDDCDIAQGDSDDLNSNGIPDECDPDCNTNGIPDFTDIPKGDSDDITYGYGTGGSRSLLMGGVAIERAADKVLDKARRIAGHLLEASVEDLEFADMAFTIVGTDRRISLAQVAQAAQAPEAAGLPAELAGPIDETDRYQATALTYPNGCHLCELEIDPETGVVELLRYRVVDDFGRVVNPLLVAGQVHGGVAQGIGQALYERTVYEAEGGQLLTGSLMDYCLPRAGDLTSIELDLVEDMPCTTNPLGVKGAGEAGTIGAAPAVMNGLMDALSPLGVKNIDMPATPERVWRLIQDARRAQTAE